jgi:hypothetical protein
MDWSRAEKVMPFILRQGDNPNVNILVNGDPTNGDFTLIGAEYQGSSTTMRQTVVTLGAVWVF